MRELVYGFVLFFIGQILIWFQTNAQFFNEWAKEHPWIMSIVGGTLISFMFIKATALIAAHYNGLLWPGRFIGFSMGITSFAFLTWWLMGEGINLKTTICVILAVAIISIQLFWK